MPVGGGSRDVRARTGQEPHTSGYLITWTPSSPRPVSVRAAATAEPQGVQNLINVSQAQTARHRRHFHQCRDAPRSCACPVAFSSLT